MNNQFYIIGKPHLNYPKEKMQQYFFYSWPINLGSQAPTTKQTLWRLLPYCSLFFFVRITPLCSAFCDAYFVAQGKMFMIAVRALSACIAKLHHNLAPESEVSGL